MKPEKKRVVYTEFSWLEMGSNRAAVLVTILIPWKNLFINIWLILKYSSIFGLFFRDSQALSPSIFLN